MILKCKNAFKEVGKKPPTITSFTRNASQREQNKNTVPSVTGLLIKNLRGKNKCSDIQGLLAHAKKICCFSLALIPRKTFLFAVQDIFLHTHPPKLQDQTTSPLLPLPLPSSPPCPPPIQIVFHKALLLCSHCRVFTHCSGTQPPGNFLPTSFWDDPHQLLQQQHSSLL